MKHILRNISFELVVVVLFILFRLPSLGNDTFNTDVWKWKSRSYDFGTGVFTFQFEKTLQKYHPGVTLMWLCSIGVKFYNFYYDLVLNSTPPDNSIKTIFELHFVQKLVIVTALGICMSLIFYAVKRISGNRLAALSVFLVSTEPFYIALSREIHLEGLLSTFMTVSILWLFLFLFVELKQRYLLLSGVFAGLSVLTKTSGFFIVPFVLSVFLFKYLQNRASRSEYVKGSAIWIGVLLLTFFVLWPSVWVQPVETFSELIRGVNDIGIERDHEQYYFGKLVDNPGYLYYIVVLGLRSSPILLVTVFMTFFLFRNFTPKTKRYVLYIVFYSLLYLVIMSIPSKKLDRYILPSMIGLSLLAAVTINHMIEKSLSNKTTGPLLISFLVLYALGTAAYLHPDYFSYYNPLFGGTRVGIHILEPKWMIGQKKIASYFLELKKSRNLEDFYEDESLDSLLNSSAIKKKLTVAFPEKYYAQIWPFLRSIGGSATILDIKDFERNSKFFVYPVWADQSANIKSLKYLDSINSHGIPLYNVYERTE